MSDDLKRKKAVIVIALFSTILLLTYFWPFPIALDDLRSKSPDAVKMQIDKVVSSLPPDKRTGLTVPPPEVKAQVDQYMDTFVKKGELDSTAWIANNTGETDRFVADIYGSELIMGMTTRVSTEGGDWANAPDPIRMMTDTNEIFRTDDAARAHELALAENATLVFVPLNRSINTGWWVDRKAVRTEKFEDARYFEKVYSNTDVVIYRVLP